MFLRDPWQFGLRNICLLGMYFILFIILNIGAFMPPMEIPGAKTSRFVMLFLMCTLCEREVYLRSSQRSLGSGGRNTSES